jgi:short-subunit dehydrogenase
MSNSSSKGTALITGASRGIGAVYVHVEALDYDFNLSKLERVMSGASKVAALGHELERRGLKRTIVVTGIRPRIVFST